MKRMVKNGDLIDVEPDGTITVAGKPIGGGGGGNERELTLIMPYPRTKSTTTKEITIEDEELWNKLNDYYYETIKIYYSDGYPLGIFTVNYYYSSDGSFSEKQYSCLMKDREVQTMETWYGKQFSHYSSSKLMFNETASSKKVTITYLDSYFDRFPMQAKFDDLYKLADKPTQDGTYVLKATVSGGAVTYTWVAQ